MKKRIFAALLAAAMAASLASCGSNDTASSGSSSSTAASAGTSSAASSSEASADAGETAADPAAEAIAARTEPQKIVVSWFTWSGSPAGVPRIAEAMNEVTIPALNLEVEMQVTDFASRSQQLTLQISGGEQLDILSSVGLGYATGIQNDYFEDLEQDDGNGNSLLETYGKDIIDAMGWDYINACRAADGTLYGICNQREMAYGMDAIVVETGALKNAEAHMDLVPDYENEVWMVNGLEDLTTIIKAIHDGNPDKDAFAPASNYLWMEVDSLGGDYFGVLDNLGQDTTEVVSLFDTATYREVVGMAHELYNYGCINPSDLTDTTAAASRIMAGSLCSYVTKFKPGSRVQESTLCGTDVTIIQGGPNFTTSTAVCGSPWTICSNTEDIVAAMQYLNFMFGSSEWNNLFKWGVEGTDYEVIDNTAKFTETTDYSHSMQWLAPAQFKAYAEYGNPSNIWELYEEFNAEAIVSSASGFVFDKAPVANEYTAITNVYNEYQKTIEYGISDPEPAIEEMKAKLDAAGYQTYMDEKQKQFDAWRAANGK